MKTTVLGLLAQKDSSWDLLTIGLVVLGIIGLVGLFIIAQFFKTWLQAYMSNADVGMGDLRVVVRSKTV